jgi:hypothetical protein
MLSRSREDEDNGLGKPLKDLERIQGAPSYLLLLYLFTRKEIMELDNDHLASIITFLARFFVRRNLTDTPPTRDLTRFFMAMIEKIGGLKAWEIVRAIEQQLIAVSASEAEFRRKLEGPIYEENSGVTRFILCALAEQAMTRKPGSICGTSIISIFMDHRAYFSPGRQYTQILGFNDGRRRREKGEGTAAGLCSQTGQPHDIGFNSYLGNKSFEEKRDRVDRQGRPVGYKNGLRLNEDLASATSWSVEQIDRRTEKLVEQVIRLFRLENP